MLPDITEILHRQAVRVTGILYNTNGINLTASGRKVVMADTGVGIRVPVTTPVSKALPVPSMGVASAAGVAKAAAAGQVVYSVTGGPDQSSGMDASQRNSNGRNKSESVSSSKIDGTSYDINKLIKTQSYTYPDGVSVIKERILKNGAQSVLPIEVRVHKGKALVVDGHHRLEAFRQLGYDRVPIKYIHGNQLGKIQKDGYTFYRSIDELLEGIVK